MPDGPMSTTLDCVDGMSKPPFVLSIGRSTDGTSTPRPRISVLRCHQTVLPPSATTFEPVMYDDASEHKKKPPAQRPTSRILALSDVQRGISCRDPRSGSYRC